MNSRPRLQSHLLTLPTILMDVLSHYKIVSRNTFERILFDLEMKLGVTRGRASVLGLDAHLMSQELDNVTRKCNQLVTSIAYQERGQVFIKDLAVRVREELLIQYVGGSSQNSVLQLKLQNALYEIRDITENCYDLAMNTIHQISCLEKRAQTLINVVRLSSKSLTNTDECSDLYHGCTKG